MPQRKPMGWPKYMVTRRLAGGVVGYYWVGPTWAKKAGCTMGSIALGSDYGNAKERCDSVINKQFDAWRGKGEVATVGPDRGTFDWMVSIYRQSTAYTELDPGSAADYDRALRDLSEVVTKDGRRRLGQLAIVSITGDVADKLYKKLKERADGSVRTRSAVAAVVAAKLAWNAAHRAKPKDVPLDNPFAKMKLKYRPKATRPFEHGELLRFVAAADVAGEGSIGTAAMIAFYWLQRQIDILNRLSWVHYRPGGSPIVKIWHHKTGKEVDLPLYDVDGSALWPELMARLDGAERHGTLIVTRDREDHWKKTRLPWKEDHFRHRVADIRDAANIDKEAKFMGLRHGGNTEGANAGLSDAQLRALSGHSGTGSATVVRYAQATMEQRQEGARKRRDQRTKEGDLSK